MLSLEVSASMQDVAPSSDGKFRSALWIGYTKRARLFAQLSSSVYTHIRSRRSLHKDLENGGPSLEEIMRFLLYASLFLRTSRKSENQMRETKGFPVQSRVQEYTDSQPATGGGAVDARR
ncbi:hypothetical protein EVAR_44151_1 [Eumeta japonica]|uniref:Uncharacterized protein n=1 Tax=Eumeta variegata TaxID=151549 RepID=A0A4C1XKU6_EUMVA|nr:hypothetical protein EVAR_44151_1 [Eumeta japonica]